MMLESDTTLNEKELARMGYIRQNTATGGISFDSSGTRPKLNSITKLLAYELGKTNLSVTHKTNQDAIFSLQAEFNPVDDVTSSDEEVIARVPKKSVGVARKDQGALVSGT